MDELVRYFLLLYLPSYLTAGVFWRSFHVWQRARVNPIAFDYRISAHNLVALALLLTGLCITLIVLLYVIRPSSYAYLGPIPCLMHPMLRLTGLLLLIGSLVWVVAAQAEMGAAWRIGIERSGSGSLVETGIFRISRNPIFLGMRATQLGLFLALPSAALFAMTVLADLLIQIQVRLEEKHLSRQHGDRYLSYCRRTRRWL